MNILRINAVITRYFYALTNSLDRMADTIYWPILDLLIWGITSTYIRSLNSNLPFIVIAFVTGLIFWYIIWRSQYEISISLMAEIWDRNIVNFFASPLKISEWIVSVIIFGAIKMLISIFVATIVSYVLYKVNVFSLGFMIIPFMASLMFTGWSIGFTTSALILRYGERIQTFVWVGPSIFMPFSAVFYPVSILPDWAQKISTFVPTSYIFEGMREVLYKDTFSLDKLILSLALNTIYLIISLSFFIFMFNKSKKLGLGRLI
jgi:ABC-2 type transport system permease protein